MTYEMTCKAHEEQEDILPKNRKDIVLRTLEDHLRENSSDEDFDDDLALLTRLSCLFFSNLYFLLIILHSSNKSWKAFNNSSNDKSASIKFVTSSPMAIKA